MSHIFNRVAIAICGMIGGGLLLWVFALRFQHPEMTKTQLFISCAPQAFLGLILLGIAYALLLMGQLPPRFITRKAQTIPLVSRPKAANGMCF